ncbi:MAG: hypothetical protein C0425_05170 [Chlorobiaceae bacterium]|nr:hypothetical protein [Chlorobiaceae bacterium]MBA4309708.1 hypothetical protein [Chlorobiaceae bacterium]
MTKIFILLFTLSVLISAQEKNSFLFDGEKRLKNVKMLTNGGENAEAYFSFDQKKLVLQITKDELKCDQIFTMNVDGSDLKMVSSGKGRKTCGYFLPGDTSIVYSSTYLHDAGCPVPPDRSKGYVWKLYDSFDIYSSALDGSNLTQLTTAHGYDAEATVSPKGDRIVFTSTRDGDPEIYSMNIDGSDQRRLTFEKGYDGGPFYSPDGSKIVFRASRPKTEKEFADYNELVKYGLVRPTTLDIFVMDSDGKNIVQVTDFGKACFAPYFHPNGKTIIFAANLQSENPRNFDLYTINIDGSNLERITFNETFDGFPMFSHDGKYLVFASNRFNAKQGDTNIFMAEWVED